MIGNVRFVNVKLLTGKLGAIEIRIVPSMFVGFVFRRFGFRPRVKPLEVTECEKCRKAVDELRKLLFLLFRFPFTHYCSFLSFLGRPLSNLHVFSFNLNPLSRFLF